MSHLGRWLSALVDSELDGVERDLVLNHLAGCDPCRLEANSLRALKRRMGTLTDAAADSALTIRLVALAEADLARQLPAAGRGPRTAAGARVSRGPAILTWPVAGAAVGMLAVAVSAAAFLMGGSAVQAPLPRVTPAVDSYWIRHDFDAGLQPAVKARKADPDDARAASSAGVP